MSQFFIYILINSYTGTGTVCRRKVVYCYIIRWPWRSPMLRPPSRTFRPQSRNGTRAVLRTRTQSAMSTCGVARVVMASATFTRRAGAGSAEAQRAGANGARIEARRAGAEARIEGQNRECGGSKMRHCHFIYSTCTIS